MAGYVGGRIKRIKIVNFMTYDHVEIYPKKGLNLIIGLNGTGKSSIMCAICLGLAGKPQFTGRAPQLSDFIKHGCQEAEIEIELESKKNNVVIHRKIKGDKSEWYINKSSSNMNDVSSTVKKFNIDTSNLCQFLPQEKVTEFSRMDKKQRLENMLQAIGEPRLFKLFNELKQLYKDISEIEQSVKKCESNKSSEMEQNDRICDAVMQQECRTRLKNELASLHNKKKIVLYQQIYEEFKELKKEMNSKAKHVETLKKEKEAALALEESICDSYRQCSSKLDRSKSQRKKIIDELTVKSNALTNFGAQVENELIEYRNKLKEKEDQKKRLHDVNQIIQGLEGQLEEEKIKLHNYSEANRGNSEALAELQKTIVKLQRIVEEISMEKNRKEYKMDQLHKELASLCDERKKKMENLRRRDRHTYEAACWLLDNKHRFKSNIFLPIMLEININSSEYAKYIENTIGFKDMIAFVCEDKSDCETLTDILKKQMKLPVNIVMAPETPLSNFKLPPLSAEYRKYGLECYVMDLFNAPDAVMRYLCNCCGINRIPVTKSIVKSNYIESILQKFNVFFSENTRISGKRSRYGERNLSIKKDFISSQNLLMHHDDGREMEIRQQLEQWKNEVELEKQKLEKCKVELAEKEKLQERYRQEIKTFKDQQKRIEKLKMNLNHKNQYCLQISVTFDEEEEKAKISRKIQSINEKRKDILVKVNSLFQDFIELEKEIVKEILGMNCLARKLKFTKDENEGIHDRLTTAENEFQIVRQKHREKKAVGDRLVAEIKKMAEYKNNEGILNSPAEHVDMSEEQIEERINHVQAQLNLNEDNESLVFEFNERKLKIDAIQKDIDKHIDKINEMKEVMQEKKTEWLEPLQHHIQNINRKFSRYFKQLSCAGEINLDVPENSDEFVKYGLQIKLKFHDDVPFTELSQTHHSGGECSVAAIVFILSLQELTEVPFRCIDEINQGMDSINERKIYQLIADSVGEDRCSQYFLLTPKLLDGLEYPDDVAVHIIFNSCFLSTTLDVKKHLEIAQSA